MKDGRSRQVLPGDPRVSGAVKRENGYNFSAVFDTDEEVCLLIYRKGEEEPEESIPIDRSYFAGNKAAVFLPKLNGRKYEYNYQVGGKVLQDVCARRIVGRDSFGELTDTDQPHKIRCGFDEENYDWEGDVPLGRPYSEMILYKLHVRGYTMHRASKVRRKGTFAGIAEKIPYLQGLGVTAVELMPVYDFDELLLPQNLPLEFASRMREKTKVNFWGYAGGNYFAPKPSYSYGKDSVREMRDLVKALHRAGLECILEFYFPAGMNSIRVLEILRHWCLAYHVDGFHLVGEGVPGDLVCQDPILRRTKLLFLNVPAGQAYGGGHPRNRNLAECNEGFKQDLRRFLKSDEDSLNGAVGRIRRNPPGYGVINYITNQDGFTMADLVAYDMKHNEANGEDNRDGSSYNFSWNCGVEGPSRRKNVRSLRNSQVKNAFLFLLLSQGVPMIYGGDEFGNSQQGNNNAYCQDNEIGWVDWQAYGRNRELVEFVREAIVFRKRHAILHQDKELRIMDYRSIGFPDLSYHSDKAWYAVFDNVSYFVGMMYCGDYAVGEDGETDDFLYVAYNFHWEPYTFALPNLPADERWHRILETGQRAEKCEFTEPGVRLEDQKMVEVQPRSIGIFIGRRESE